MTTTPPSDTPPKKKASSVRHTRAVQRDRSKRLTVAPPDERILTLPVMVALVLSLIWRQIGGVCELARSEKLLWLPPLHVTQQALSERLSTFPAELFLA